MEINHAYAAGLMDGEGTITLSYSHKEKKYRTPIVSVSSTTYELLEFMQQSYGGHISKHKVYKDHHKQSWSWKIPYNQALLMLEKILPFMKEPTKIYRANLLLTQYKDLTPRNGKYTPEMHEAKLAFEHSFFHPSSTIL